HRQGTAERLPVDPYLAARKRRNDAETAEDPRRSELRAHRLGVLAERAEPQITQEKRLRVAGPAQLLVRRRQLAHVSRHVRRPLPPAAVRRGGLRVLAGAEAGAPPPERLLGLLVGGDDLEHLAGEPLGPLLQLGDLREGLGAARLVRRRLREPTELLGGRLEL